MGEEEYQPELEMREATMARVLMKAGQITQEQVESFLAYRHQRENNGKPYLGQILIDLGLISKDDIAAYVAKNHSLHVKLVEQLVREGYLTAEQQDLLFAKEKETGQDLISLMSDLNIMTRENYTKIFNKRSTVLRLGEWLVIEQKKITQDQLDQAVRLQSVTEFDDYLMLHCGVSADLIKKVREKIAEHYTQ